MLAVDIHILYSGNDQKVGSLVYDGRQIQPSKDDSLLQTILTEPIQLQRNQIYQADSDPEEFFNNLYRQYSSPYLRATKPYQTGGRRVKASPFLSRRNQGLNARAKAVEAESDKYGSGPCAGQFGYCQEQDIRKRKVCTYSGYHVPCEKSLPNVGVKDEPTSNSPLPTVKQPPKTPKPPKAKPASAAAPKPVKIPEQPKPREQPKPKQPTPPTHTVSAKPVSAPKPTPSPKVPPQPAVQPTTPQPQTNKPPIQQIPQQTPSPSVIQPPQSTSPPMASPPSETLTTKPLTGEAVRQQMQQQPIQKPPPAKPEEGNIPSSQQTGKPTKRQGSPEVGRRLVESVTKKTPDGKQEPDPVAKQILDNPKADQITAAIPEGSQHLGSGPQSMVFQSSDTEATRIAPVMERPDIPEMLQPTNRQEFGDYMVETLPLVSMENITKADIQKLNQQLQQRGYSIADTDPNNFGRTLDDGRLVVTDPTAIRKTQQPQSSTTEQPNPVQQAEIPQPRPPSKDYTGEDTLGRKWEQGKLISAEPTPSKKLSTDRVRYQKDRSIRLDDFTGGKPVPQINKQIQNDLNAIGLDPTAKAFYPMFSWSSSAVRSDPEVFKRLQKAGFLEPLDPVAPTGSLRLTTQGAVALGRMNLGDAISDPTTLKDIGNLMNFYKTLDHDAREKLQQHFGIVEKDKPYDPNSFRRSIEEIAYRAHNPEHIADRVRNNTDLHSVVSKLGQIKEEENQQYDKYSNDIENLYDELEENTGINSFTFLDYRIRDTMEDAGELTPQERIWKWIDDDVDPDRIKLTPQEAKARLKVLQNIQQRYKEVLQKREEVKSWGQDQVSSHLRSRVKSSSPIKISEHGSEVEEPFRQSMDRAVELLQGTVSQIKDLDGGPLHPYKTHVDPKESRAYYNYIGHTINVGTDQTQFSPEIAIHELMHGIEQANPSIWMAIQEFWRYRIGDESPTNLKKEFPLRSFRDDEQGYRDEFDKAFPERESSAYYTGKRYNEHSTEILSMGAELLYRDPSGFAARDPEFCAFIVGILDGSLRAKPIPKGTIEDEYEMTFGDEQNQPKSEIPSVIGPNFEPLKHNDWKELPADSNYLYHATTLENLYDIAQGKLIPHRPWHGTDQSTWPDGSKEKRSYFATSPVIAWQFAPEEGTPVLLRIPKKASKFKAEFSTDYYTTNSLDPTNFDVVDENGNWNKIKEPKKEQNASTQAEGQATTAQENVPQLSSEERENDFNYMLPGDPVDASILIKVARGDLEPSMLGRLDSVNYNDLMESLDIKPDENSISRTNEQIADKIRQLYQETHPTPQPPQDLVTEAEQRLRNFGVRVGSHNPPPVIAQENYKYKNTRVKERENPIKQKDLDRLEQKLFNGKADFDSLGSLLGVPDESEVTIIKTPIDPEDGWVEVKIRHPHIKNCERIVHVDFSGDKWIKNENFFVKDNAPDGFGRDVFAKEVYEAANLGFKYIQTYAGGNIKSSSMNGYYTWPRFGYNIDINDMDYDKLESKIHQFFPHAIDILDVMMTENARLPPDEEQEIRKEMAALDRRRGKPVQERPIISGANWWQIRGIGMELKFDLTPGSKSWRALGKYLESSQRKPKNGG
ncbi:MAG: hypothetical protein KGL39_12525 [Patescibacteria group bacterium]|nr:hypothetical protein [Patescibacteria group bacterium]